jgi:nucleotide-binding universal stress UspA family protein
MSYRRILFVQLEESDAPALERTLALARRSGARVTVAAIAEEPALDLHGAADLDVARLAELALEDRRDALEELRAKAGAGPEVSSKLLTGTPFLAVIREVLREGYDLVALSGERPPGVLDRVLPSTVTHLLRKCPCPVWLVRPFSSPACTRIAAAVDADPDAERRALDGSILAAALRFGGAFSAQVSVVHALTIFPSAATLRVRGRLSEDQIQAVVDRATATAEARLRKLVADQGAIGVEMTTHVVEGPAPHALPRFVQEAPVDLLVMGTVGRTGIKGLLIGNTAEEILARTPGSILAVKPPGFVSPVVAS